MFGLKPSRGRVSTAPFPSLEGLSTSGPISRSVADAAAFLDVLAGYEPGDPWWAPPPARPYAEEVGADPGRLRIAFTSTPPYDTPVDPECVAALESAASLVAELGHHVVEKTPAWATPGLAKTFITVWQVSPALYPGDPALYTPLNRGLVEAARATTAADYASAVFEVQATARRVVQFWQDFDVVLTPTLALLPVPIGWQEDGAEDAVAQLMRNVAFTPFTAIANMTGLPAMSLPLHWSGDGLPIGVQAIGPPAGEAVLLRLAAQIESARPWAERRPAVS